MAKQKEFIPLNTLWDNNFIYKSSFKLNWFQKLKKKLTKKNITRTICIINMIIPMTFWPATNPIICKISNKIDKDKLGRKVNCIKMRFM